MVQPPVGFLQLLENKTNLPRITLAKSNELLECSPSRHRQRWIAVPTRHTVGRGSCFVTRDTDFHNDSFLLFTDDDA